MLEGSRWDHLVALGGPVKRRGQEWRFSLSDCFRHGSRRLANRYGHSQVAHTQVSKQHLGLVAGHVPHETSCPQLFRRVPHVWPALLHARPLSVQPHWLGTPPPPQVSGAVQEPQSSVPPEP